MPYVTTYKPAKMAEISLDQMLCGSVDENVKHKTRTYPGTVTRYCDNPPYSSGDIQRLISILKSLPYLHIERDLKKEYKIYQIPKRNGGLRTICAPSESLTHDHLILRSIFEKEFFALYHTTAFAYCKGRNAKHCIARHQANQSKWFLKLDFADFFGQTNKSFVLRQLSQIAPFSEVMKDSTGAALLSKAIDICFLNDGLPQGTIISPMLTNLIMIPFDHEINRILHKKGFVYTRYADDIQISHKEKFNPGEVINLIRIQLREMRMPYKIKNEKTRFGSSSGRNWNLGLMLNHHNRITIGHQEHKIMKARIFSFLMDCKSGKRWTREEMERLAGQVAYMRSVEPYTTDHIIRHLNEKCSANYAQLMRGNMFFERIIS